MPRLRPTDAPCCRPLMMAPCACRETVTNRQSGWQAYHYPDGGAFSVTPDHRRLIAHGPEAWRYLRWEVRDEANRLVELLPAGF